MKTSTHTLLEITPEHLGEIRLKTFMDWVAIHNKTPIAFQLALSSKALQKYFTAHYEALEADFREQIADYVHLPKADKNEFYAEVTNRILLNYPGALLPKPNKSQQTLINQN